MMKKILLKNKEEVSFKNKKKGAFGVVLRKGKKLNIINLNMKIMSKLSISPFGIILNI